MDQNHKLTFDIEALNDEVILKKRTSLALIYMKNVKEWLETNQTNSYRRNMQIIEQTLNGFTKNLTLKMLEDLRKLLQKIFDDPQSNPIIEISSDEDEGPEKTSSVNDKLDPNMSVQQDVFKLDNQNLPTLTDSDNQPTTTKNITTKSTPDLSFEDRSSPSVNGVELAAGIKTTTKKKVCFEPVSHADVPSIGTYAFKKNKMVSPALYAKPKELAQRKTTSVPYKSASIQKIQQKHDPQKEAIKLAGIKEKIYAKNYLQLDADRKEEMQEKYRRNLQSNSSQTSDSDNDINGANVDEPTRRKEQKKSEMRKCPLPRTKEDETPKQIEGKKPRGRPRKIFEDASKKAHKNSLGKRGRGRPKKTLSVPPETTEISSSNLFVPVMEELNDDASSSNIEPSSKAPLIPPQQATDGNNNHSSSLTSESIYESDEDLLVEMPVKCLRKVIRKVHKPNLANINKKTKNVAMKQEKK